MVCVGNEVCRTVTRMKRLEPTSSRVQVRRVTAKQPARFSLPKRFSTLIFSTHSLELIKYSPCEFPRFLSTYNLNAKTVKKWRLFVRVHTLPCSGTQDNYFLDSKLVILSDKQIERKNLVPSRIISVSFCSVFGFGFSRNYPIFLVFLDEGL
jgi:hypothetical protein